ncbi:2-C-methyl-D-erythritol 4-phosphate cytidylyltransferase [Bacillus dakarensis]|uniref:2-C-methyl-D-erythritol 4-phosphate cytidylyltransferase n=1 Tax=Robertmurraya dakarensis TaxID=1926278 RepID=UPI0009817A8C|nr:2-C-methyl-D-erythritol 4-phosphate cytidylyltransferase [Bacillus dakarensis]
MAYQVIIPAAGQGKRMGAGKNKLLLTLNDIPIFVHTLMVFENDEKCDGIILVISPNDEETFKDLISNYQIHKVTAIVYGGKERQNSVYNGLKAVQSSEVILVHDGARPFIDIDTIHALVDEANIHGAAVVAVPVKDTIKRVENNEVIETVERSSLWAIQTPQAFRVPLLLEAHQWAEENGYTGTDDASLVEKINKPVKIVQGSYDNIKLTTSEDLYFAEAIMKKQK